MVEAPLLVLLLIAVIAGSFQKVDYASLAPGWAKPSEPLVSISGHPTYDGSGTLYFVTVDVITKTTAFEAVTGWLLPNVDVYPLRDVIGTATPAQDDRLNLLEMSDSKRVAQLVAFNKLGIPVTVHNLGAVVASISAGTPAASALEVGDVITAVGSTKVGTSDELRKVLAGHHPGDHVTLSVVRYDPSQPPGTGPVASIGPAVPVAVTLAARPDHTPGGFLGIVPEDDKRLTFPFDVSINTGNVGGPSAGLAWTLSLIDKLTPGGILHGHKVAVTGTISPDGSVGDVGGVGQKTIAAHRAGAKLFLVPDDEVGEARRHATGGLEVVGVSSVDDALNVLKQMG